MIHKDTQMNYKGHKRSQSYPTIPFSNHTLYSKEDLRSLITASLTIVIIVHFVNVTSCTYE
jgi:hypothetical protein